MQSIKIASLLIAALLSCATSVFAITGTHEIQTCTTTGTGPYTSGAFTPVAGDLLFVMAVVSNSADLATVSSSVGTTFSLPLPISRAIYRTSLDTVHVFVANEYSTAVSQTITLDVTADPGTGACIAVVALQGLSRTGLAAVKQVARQQNQAAGGTPAPAFGDAVITTNATIGVIGNNSNPAAMTAPAGWTEGAADSGYATPTTGFEYVFRASGFTGTTVTWGSTSATTFASFIVELDAEPCPSRAMLGVGCR